MDGILKGVAFASLLMAAVGTMTVIAQESGLKLSGEAATDIVATVSDPFELDGAVSRTGSYNGASSLRLDARAGDRVNTKLEASVVAHLVYGDAAAAARQQADRLLGPVLSAYLLGVNGPVLTAELRKLYFSIYTDFADISVGRMIVNFGRGTVFSPADLFATIDTSDLALGRVGQDVIRALVPLGDLAGLDLVAGLSKPPADATAGARAYANFGGWDIAAAVFRDGGRSDAADEALVFGLDAKGDLELGITAETVLRLPLVAGAAVQDAIDLDAASLHGMAGIDYSFAGAWFFDLEYAANRPLAASGQWPKAGKPAFGSFRGDHNLFASAAWKVDDFTTLDARVVANLSGGDLQASLAAARTLSPGAMLSAYALYRTGDVEGKGAIDQPSGALGLRLAVRF